MLYHILRFGFQPFSIQFSLLLWSVVEPKLVHLSLAETSDGHFIFQITLGIHFLQTYSLQTWQLSLTWSLRSSGRQSAQSEDDGSLVLLDNLGQHFLLHGGHKVSSKEFQIFPNTKSTKKLDDLFLGTIFSNFL